VSWGSGKVPRSWRLSEKALENLKKHATQKNLNQTRALNLVLEKLEEAKPQLERSPEKEGGRNIKCPHCEGEIVLSAPLNVLDAVGTIVQCPIRPVAVPYESPFVIWKAPVDASVCKTCSKYPCETWEIIESEKRLGLSKTPLP